jgi:sulfur carrier protein ThiS
MGGTVRVHLGGHLSWYDLGRRSWLEVWPEGSPSGLLTPADVARRLGLPRAEIALVAVNGRIVDPETASLAPDDRVEFYPPIGGG